MAAPDDGKATNDQEMRNFGAKADDLPALLDSVVNAASVSSALWISYLGVLFYLLIAVGSVTHKDLFLENSIRLPFISVDLPMNLMNPLIYDDRIIAPSLVGILPARTCSS